LSASFSRASFDEAADFIINKGKEKPNARGKKVEKEKRIRSFFLLFLRAIIERVYNPGSWDDEMIRKRKECYD
jgi:hypothetical protein